MEAHANRQAFYLGEGAVGAAAHHAVDCHPANQITTCCHESAKNRERN